MVDFNSNHMNRQKSCIMGLLLQFQYLVGIMRASLNSKSFHIFGLLELWIQSTIHFECVFSVTHTLATMLHGHETTWGNAWCVLVYFGVYMLCLIHVQADVVCRNGYGTDLWHAWIGYNQHSTLSVFVFFSDPHIGYYVVRTQTTWGNAWHVLVYFGVCVLCPIHVLVMDMAPLYSCPTPIPHSLQKSDLFIPLNLYTTC